MTRRLRAPRPGRGDPTGPSAWHGPARPADADAGAAALARAAEAEDTLRAIGAGEVDAFVVADNGAGRRVFTLTNADRPYRMFVENMRDGAATVSSGGLILYANARLAEMLSCTRGMLLGSPLERFVGGAPPRLDEIRDRSAGSATVEIDLIDADGATVPVLVGVSPIDVDGDDLTCLTFTDLTAQKAQDREIARLGHVQAARLTELQLAQAALIEQATHDGLTGLPNRALLVDRIDQALLRARRSGGCIAAFFVDLDRFKQINDTQGHVAGDVVLQRVARRLTTVLRPMDTVCRLGGDEFVVLAPQIEGHLDAVDIGLRIVAEIARRPARLEGGEAVTASVGVAVAGGGRGTAEALLDQADSAMYKAKALGGGRAEVFDAALGHEVRRRLAAHQLLAAALDEHRVIAHFQPIIDLSTGLTSGFEALARIIAIDGSTLSPATFISSGEDSGLIVPLGTHVLGLACDEARRWSAAGGVARLTVAVNISSRQFEAGDLVGIVRAHLGRTGLDPHQLQLELTETAIIDLRPEILDQLGRLRELGVQIGLDDFGTGYASLTHLRRLPLTFVKIDQSFVRGLETCREDERIVSAVIDLAANLGLSSIAEGVETEGQLRRLRDLGCDRAQGYLFARPLRPDDVPEVLRRSPWSRQPFPAIDVITG